MVAEYNKAAREIFGAHGPGLQSGRMEGFQYDLLADSHSGSGPDTGPGTADVNPLPSGTLAPFDVIVVGMALHHVTAPGRLLKRFSELLKPGGVCVVLDMVPGSAQLGHSEDLKEVGHEGSVLATIGKHGFTEVEMRDLYEGAGMWGALSTRYLTSGSSSLSLGSSAVAWGLLREGRSCDVRLSVCLRIWVWWLETLGQVGCMNQVALMWRDRITRITNKLIKAEVWSLCQ